MKLDNSLGLASAESEEEEFFECTSEELANDEVPSTRTQLKAKHLLWNKPAGRLAKHPSLRLTSLLYEKAGDTLLIYKINL